MPELSHTWSGDLALAPDGDLAVVDGTQAGQQRVLRRLLTNDGDYFWHAAANGKAGYGAGLPAKVGTTLDAKAIESLIRSQIFNEAAVARSPQPTVTVTAIPNGVSVYVKYYDAETSDPVTVSFDINR